MARRWHFDDPQYMRITCDELGCVDDLIVPTTDPAVALALATESGWQCAVVDSDTYPREDDRCPAHVPDSDDV